MRTVNEQKLNCPLYVDALAIPLVNNHSEINYQLAPVQFRKINSIIDNEANVYNSELMCFEIKESNRFIFSCSYSLLFFSLSFQRHILKWPVMPLIILLILFTFCQCNVNYLNLL